MSVGIGGPISVPSRLRLKLSVTEEPFEFAGGFQQASRACPTWSIESSGAAVENDGAMKGRVAEIESTWPSLRMTLSIVWPAETGGN
jgi:hypothetical protein